MSNSTVKLLINAAEFPFTYAQAARATLENQDASPRMPYTFYGDRANADFGMPQLIYCENVLPYAKGLFTVSYYIQAPAFSPAITTADQAIILRDVDENLLVFVPAIGNNYIYDPSGATWASVSPFVFINGLVTRAYVNGRTFVCYEKNRIIEYNTGTGLFDTIALTYPAGITIADVRGIFNASNYLGFFTEFAVYWCSPLNVLEFANLDQGAGTQIPLDITGQITSVVTIPGGFVIYTIRNAIGARFTNNSSAPFAFKAINNAGGTASYEVIADGSEDGGHYAYTTRGLQKINLDGASNIFPAATDFLVGKQIERWNSTTKSVDIEDTSLSFTIKLAWLAGRYLVISYGNGTTNFEFALVYDSALERWGKLRIDHVDAFTYPYVSATAAYTYDTLPGYYSDLTGDYYSLGLYALTVQPAKGGMAFLKSTGEIQIFTTDFAQDSAPGVAVFGHLQERHDKLITFLDLWVDGLKSLPTPVVTLLSSETGDERDDTATMDLESSTARTRHYSSRVTALNFDVAIEGTMVLSSLLAGVKKHGYR